MFCLDGTGLCSVILDGKALIKLRMWTLWFPLYFYCSSEDKNSCGFA